MNCNEQCWILVGEKKDDLWWAKAIKETTGLPASVAFDPYYVMEREKAKGDIIGFSHTHPSFPASPSITDYKTMRAWYNCLGKPLVCLIEGVDGLRAWWFEDDESDPEEYQAARIGRLVFGVTPELFAEPKTTSLLQSPASFFTNPVNSKVIEETKRAIEEEESNCGCEH